ncbi:MAG: bactofilin family protein [Paludibacteraceae bacterium]
MAKFQEETVNTFTSGNGGIINIIASGTKIIGKVSVESDFRLDGEVEGDIFGKTKVVIGEKGYLKGSLTCANAEIIGRVNGNINTSQSLTLRSTAELNGDVKIKSLIVEPNAIFNGTCSMRENGQPQQSVHTQTEKQ